MPRSSVRQGVVPARVVLSLAVVGSGLGTILVAQGPGRLTTYAGQSGWAATLTVSTGMALALAGLVMSLNRPSERLGDLTLLAGLVWFAPVWVGWDEGPDLVRSIGLLAAGFTFPLLVHVVLALPSGRLRTRVSQGLVWAAYLGTLLAALGRALFKDPFWDPDCWAICTHSNVFLLKSSPAVASAIDTTDRLFTTTIAAAFAILCVWRLVTASAAARRGLLPVAMPALLASASVAAHSVAMVRSPLEGPFKPLYDVNVFIATFVTGCIALILLAGGLVWGSVRTWLQRRAVARIVSRLGEAPDPGSVESALAHALGDPQLTIAYWLPDSERYVDAYGRPAVEPVTMPGRVVSALVIGERQVARVVHAQGPDIEAEMGAAMRLALDNERLQAEGLAQLEELRASRARIVAAGDDERRRLERDLHDGAQQTLLAASYDIRLARSSADTERDAETGSVMTAALDGTQLALDELRELANGIYPAILGEAGLAAALASLADTVQVRLEVVETTTERFSSPIETTAYLLVVEAVEDAATRDATSTTVSVVGEAKTVIVTVEDDGVPRTSAMFRSADRVGALGGHLDVGPVTLRGAIPCG